MGCGPLADVGQAVLVDVWGRRMDAINNLIRYFDLYSRRRSTEAVGHADDKKPNLNLWLLAQYAAVLLGIVAKLFLDSLEKDGPAISWPRLIVSVIVATSIFPAVYKQALEEAGPGFIQLCVTFTAGLGYKTLTDIGV